MGSTSDATPAHFRVPYNWILGTIFALLSLFSVLGNVSVLVIICRYRRMRTTTNLLLANLASIDLLTGLFVIPFSAATAFSGGWIMGELACKINGFLNPLFVSASIHTLMYIALQKYLSLRTTTGPATRGSTSRVKRTVMMIAAVWIWGCLFASGTVTGWISVEYKNGTSQCGPKFPDEGSIRELSHSLFTGITNYIIPFIVICFSYISIFRTFQRSMETLKSNFQSLPDNDYFRRQRKIITTLLIIFCSFLICLTPYICYSSTMAAYPRARTLELSVLNPIAYIFLYLSSCINPVIYALRSSEFALAYKSLIKGLCCEDPGPEWSKALARTPPSVRQRRATLTLVQARKTNKSKSSNQGSSGGSIRTNKFHTCLRSNCPPLPCCQQAKHCVISQNDLPSTAV